MLWWSFSFVCLCLKEGRGEHCFHYTPMSAGIKGLVGMHQVAEDNPRSVSVQYGSSGNKKKEKVNFRFKNGMTNITDATIKPVLTQA